MNVVVMVGGFVAVVRRDESAAVIHVDPGWDPAGRQRGAQRGGQPHGVFRKAEPVADR